MKRNLSLWIALAILLPITLGGCASVDQRRIEKSAKLAHEEAVRKLGQLAEELKASSRAERDIVTAELPLLAEKGYFDWIEKLGTLDQISKPHRQKNEMGILELKSAAEQKIFEAVKSTGRDHFCYDGEHFVILGEPSPEKDGGVLISIVGVLKGELVLVRSSTRKRAFPIELDAPPFKIAALE